MRVLYIANGSNMTNAGGMEYHLVDIRGWFENKGVETAAAVRKGTYLERRLWLGKPNVYPLSWNGPAKVKGFVQVGKAILKFAPDIISINRERDIKRIFFIARFLRLFTKNRPKIVAVFHNVGCRLSFDLERLDGLIFPNEYMKVDYISGNRNAEKKAKVINHGVRLPEIDPSLKMDPRRERRFFKGSEFPLLGMVGEFRKNQSELIDVAFHLKKKLPHFTVAFVGRGTEEEIRPLQEKIDRMGLTKNFIFTGNVDRDRIPDVFYDLDISVTTNRAEAFGMVFIESLASYTPLVAFASGGPVEILTKGGGILVNGGPEDMAEQLFMLISDQEALRSMGREGRRAAEEYFSIDAMGKKHYAFYTQLLEKSGQR
jgi:glycosyltransferase involved in cell wall biosynthesis